MREGNEDANAELTEWSDKAFKAYKYALCIYFIVFVVISISIILCLDDLPISVMILPVLKKYRKLTFYVSLSSLIYNIFVLNIFPT